MSYISTTGIGLEITCYCIGNAIALNLHRQYMQTLRQRSDTNESQKEI